MSHRRHRHWSSCRQDCTCSLCAELDIHHPGEGVQLRLPIHPAPHLAGQSEGSVTS